MIFKLLLLYTSFINIAAVSLEEIFKDAYCIEGKLSFDDANVIVSAPVPQNSKDNLELTNNKEKKQTHLLTELILVKGIGNNVLSTLNEVAQFNGVTISYLLEKEEGMSHDKIFFIRLDIGDETYYGTGKSIKSAQQSAAALALEKTKLEKPPKSEAAKVVEKLTPTVHLNNIALKLGLKVQYINDVNEIIDENDLIPGQKSYNYISLDYSSKSYMSKLNESLKKDSKKLRNVNVEEKQDQGPFKVMVMVGNKEFLGNGVTIQMAKHDAAEKALESFKQMSMKDAEACLIEGEECNKLAIKSPVSMVYELSQQRGYSVEFEIVDTTGPDHKKEYTTACRVGSDLVTTGIGASKKKSKTSAAEKMLEKLNAVEPIMIGTDIRVNTPNNKKKNKKKKVVKSTMQNVQNSVYDAVNSVLSTFTLEPGSSDDDSINDGDDAKSSKNEFMKLARDIGINVFFSTFLNGDEHSTVISLNTNPSIMCYGQDKTASLSEESAALNAIKFLKDVGLDNIILPLKETKNNLPTIVLKTKRPILGSQKG